MKRTLLNIFSFLACTFSIQAQTLYGTTTEGGTDQGTVIKFIPAINSLSVTKSFISGSYHPSRDLVRASDGKLYGMTKYGGASDYGTIFSFDPSTAAYHKLMNFNGANGKRPESNLMQASDGKLYGMTLEGGKKDVGVIFSFDPSTFTYTKIMDFDAINGGFPRASLIQASDGKLYGVTGSGAIDDFSFSSVLFYIDPSNYSFKKLKTFDQAGDGNPIGSPVQGSDGKLYGIMGQSGNDGGVIYSFDPVSFTFTKLKSFGGINGSSPTGSLILAGNGKFYGMTGRGGINKGGVIFSYDPSTSTYKKLKDFDLSTGINPTGILAQANDGMLYGITNGDGGPVYSAIFSLDPTSSAFTLLKNLEGNQEAGSLVQAIDGKLYGIMPDGDIYSFNPSSSAYEDIVYAQDNRDGGKPQSSLIQAADGKLYGTAGFIFSIDPLHLMYKKLNVYGGDGDLMQARDGKLYGMSNNQRYGEIFSFDPSSATYAELWKFDDETNGLNGAGPSRGLIQAKDGKLYGTTVNGGTTADGDGPGIIFSYDPVTSTFKNLRAFDYTNGASPLGNLLQASDGKLYGMTYQGGKNDFGVMFSYDPFTYVYKNLKDFDGTEGRHPRGNLIQASNGKLYGMTSRGGSSDSGVVFSYDPLTSMYTRLKDLYGTNGSNPYGSLMQASDGKLYGMTRVGGSNNLGVVFSYDLTSSSYTKLTDFNAANGANPGYGAFIEVRDSAVGVAPEVKLTAPVNDSIYAGGTTIHLAATASDQDGAITKVAFYNGNALLYTATDTPYTFNWQKVDTGRYSLIAEATDNRGLVTLSDTVRISVVLPGLRITISGPVNNSLFNDTATVNITTAATYPGGTIDKVEFYNRSILLHTDDTIPYTYSWKNPPAGNYVLTAKAISSNGDTIISAQVKGRVFKTPPAAVAGTLYGTTSAGGSRGAGTINAFKPPANNLTVARSFENFARFPTGDVIQANDGKLYGMTGFGGINDNGVIFSFDLSSSVYAILYVFNDTDGRNANGNLVQASDGILYGMTYGGGSKGLGVIFSFDPSNAIYTKVKDFDSINGANPYGSLIQAADGKLYGLTSAGGKNNLGVVFSFDPFSSAYVKLHELDKANGASPHGSLVQASDGLLYGMTYQGGSKDFGVIFSVDPSTSTYTRLKDFNGTGGAYHNPSGNLIQATDGKLYGVTHQNGGKNNWGTIFSFDPYDSAYVTLFNFDGINGYYPTGSLLQSGNGTLYGITEVGVFSFDPSTSTYTKKDFDGTNGSSPYGSLLQATNGKMYGTTSRGGGNNGGTIFSFDPASLKVTKLQDLATNETGSIILSGLVRARDKKLYGMTAYGGSKGYGVIFSFDPSSYTYKNLKNFDGMNGGYPKGGLVQASGGKLYGMTSDGGTNGTGVIFSFDPSSLIYTKLKDFDSYSKDYPYGNVSGASPVGNLIQASNGKLYGMTPHGGSQGQGVIFSFDPSSGTFTKLTDFDGANGSSPQGSLMQAKDGKLYGTAGVIFSFDPSASAYTKLKNKGDGTLIQANSGILYGTSVNGGSDERGAIFSFDPSTSVYAELKAFTYLNNTDGYYPAGSLLQAKDGKLYGTTSEGGSSDKGVIFSFEPFTLVYAKLKDFEGDNGATPYSPFIEIADSVAAIAPTISLTSPANNATYLAGGNVYLNAAASDSDGIVSKVAFYADSTLLFTAIDTPYTFKWQKVNTGNYTLTAKATDNSGLVTTSAPVYISVVLNKPPAVRIITPLNDQTFTAPANIHVEAIAQDSDGRVTTVRFYNDTTLLTLERLLPYTCNSADLPAGTYTFTAVATDNWGAVTASAPITVTVTSTSSLVSGTPPGLKSKSALYRTVSVNLAPNPVKNILHFTAAGLQKNIQTLLSVISPSGVILKTKQINHLTPNIQLDVSSLAGGVYTLRLAGGGLVWHQKFVKL